MTIKTFTFSPFQENTYVVSDETNEAVLIDAGCYTVQEQQVLKQYIEQNGLTLVRVINTHLHLDHHFGNKFIYDTYKIKPEAGEEDEFMIKGFQNMALFYRLSVGEAQPLGKYIVDNEVIEFGNSSFVAIHAPGHSPGSMMFYSEKEGVLFSGDVLFQGSIGRTDLPNGDHATLIKSLTDKVLPLPDSTIVYSGHGAITTIGEEKKSNPYL